MIENKNLYYILLVFIIIVAALLIVTSSCATKSNSKNAENFQQTAPMKELVLYYASWCGHCKTFMPIWDNFALQFADESRGVRVRKVECNESTKEMCQSEGIQGFPTIVLYENGNKQAFPGATTLDALNKMVGY